ncbi:MAG: hypothetical protein IJ179_00115 [Oscillospiraceae bacterium]|nr:hypothetical protein [Oscillospiraceae bacterium]
MCYWRKLILPILLVLAFCLAGCGSDAPAAPANPVETAPLTVTLDGIEFPVDTQELTISGETQILELVENAAAFPELRTLNIDGAVTAQQLDVLRGALPNVQLRYSVSLLGKTLPVDTTSLDLTGLSSGQVADAAQSLSLLPQLAQVELSDALTVDDYIQLKKAAPQAQFAYSFDLFGQTVTTETESLTYSRVPIGNDGVLVFSKVLPYLDKLQELRIEYCDIADWAMADLRDSFPDKKIAWRVVYGWGNSWSDTERIWAIGGFGDANLFPLRYCTEVKYLDLGHNGIYSLDFVRYMPNLEVFIVENDFVSDLTPLASCKNLEFLEVGETQVTDVSPLAACTSLKHLNIGGLLGLTDISPLYELPNLERLYGLCDVNVPAEQVEYITALMPNTEVAFHYDPKGAVNGYHWRYAEGGGLVPRYQLLHDQIGYDW